MSLASRATKRLHELYKAVLLRMRLLNARRFHPCRSTLAFQIQKPSMMEELEPRVLLSGTAITVDTFQDVVDEYDGLTSLREAITIAAENAGDDVINLPTGNYTLANGQLSINDSAGALFIVGVGGEATLDADGASQVMEVAYGSMVSLEQIGIVNGYTDTGEGGGIYNMGELALLNCTVTGNQVVESRGGGIYNDVEAQLFLENTTFNDNSASYDGGAVSNLGELDIRGCTFVQNSTQYGSGGAIFNDSSAIVLNSTLTQNNGYIGAGIYNSSNGEMTVTNATISQNISSSNGGGIWNEGVLYLDNTILAGNTGSSGLSDFYDIGTTESRIFGGPTNNLIESADGHSIVDGVNGNIVGQSAMLGVLADNGGVTQTMLPAAGSLAINAGNDDAASDAEVSYDQRGETFSRFVDTVDIGAVETESVITYGAISGQVWDDVNADGVAETGESGIDGVTVELYRDNGDGLFDLATDTLYDSVETQDGGYYNLQEIDAEMTYFVRVVLPSTSYVFSPQGQDSDVDADGVSELQSFQTGIYLDCDAGLVPVLPEIDVEYDSQDDVHSVTLDVIDLGTSTTATFTIRNEGDAPLELGPIAFYIESPFSVTDINGDPISSTTILAAGETLQIVVHYTPTEQGRDVDTLLITSNDADEPIYELTVTGQAVLPQGEGYYEVWGGNTDYRSDTDDTWAEWYYNIDQWDYVYLGGGLDAYSLTEFLGSTDYDYYVIVTRAMVQVDSVEGGDDEYGYSVGDGNTYDWNYVYGSPDEQYATIGYQGNSDSFCGFMIVENTNNGWDGLTIYTGNISLPMHISIQQSAVTDGTGEAYLYEHSIDVYDQGWSTSVRFQAPSGEWYDLFLDDGNWEYWDESYTSIVEMVSEFGDGWYTIEASGSPFGTVTTQVWFGDADGETPLAWPSQVPEITNITSGDTDVSTNAALEWSLVTDPNVTNIYSDIEDVNETTWAQFWLDAEETSTDPAELAAGTNYEWDLQFENSRDGVTASGYGYYVSRSLETTVVFRTEGGEAALPNLAMGEVYYTSGIYQAGDTIDMDFLLGNLGDGNAVVVGEDGLIDVFYTEVRLSFDTVWGNSDDVVIYRRADTYWLGQEAVDTQDDPTPMENWYGGLIVIPEDIERGNYYVLAGIDVENQVVESNESDNIWISENPDISVETLTGVTQVKHVLSVGVANTAVGFRGDVAAQRINAAFEGMEGVITNLLIRYNTSEAGNLEHFLATLEWFESRVLPGDQFIIYIAAQACYDLEGNEVAVDAQYNTATGKWNLTETTTGDEYLYLSSVDGEDNWLSDDKLAMSFFTYSWAAANKLFIIDTPYAGGFIGTDDPANESQYDLSLLYYDPSEVLESGEYLRTQWATGSLDIIAAAGEGEFAYMTPERIVSWAGVNRMGTHMLAPILAQAGNDVLDVEQLFWQTQESNSVYSNEIGMLFAFADGDPDLETEDLSGGTVIDPATGNIHVQLGADVKLVVYYDADGSKVALRLSGGVADLTFCGENLRQIVSGSTIIIKADGGAMLYNIQLIDSTAAHTLTIAVSGGDKYADLGSISGGGSLRQLTASRVNLVGEGINLEGDAYITITRLHNIKNGADVNMAGEGPAAGIRFYAATVFDGTDMNFGGSIRILYLLRWIGGSLKANSVRSFYVRKDMGADVTLTDVDSEGRSIYNARIFGNVTGGEWNVAGAVWNLYVRGDMADTDLQFNGTTQKMFIRGSLVNSSIQLADDARVIRIVGMMDQSQLTSQGDIRTMILGAMRNSTVFAGVRADYDTDLNGDGVLDLPSLEDLNANAGRITNFQVRGMRDVVNPFENSNIAAGSFGSVRLKTSSLENPNGVGGTSQAFGLTASADGVDKLRLTLNRKNYYWRNHTWTRNLDAQDLAVFDQA